MQVVTLTTDYGTSDYYLAELKGTLLSVSQDIQLIDVSHTIESYDIVQAAFFVSACYARFPKGTIHIISVYNYYDQNAAYVICQQKGQYFIAPNNGVLSLIFPEIDAAQVVGIDFSTDSLSAIFAHAVAALHHDLPCLELGKPALDFVKKMDIQPVILNDQIRVTIIHIDHYENVMVNIKETLFEKIRNGRKFALYYKQTEPLCIMSQHYGDVEVGETLCLFNSAGFLEIAVNMGKASTMYNLNKSETIQINFLD